MNINQQKIYYLILYKSQFFALEIEGIQKVFHLKADRSLIKITFSKVNRHFHLYDILILNSHFSDLGIAFKQNEND